MIAIRTETPPDSRLTKTTGNAKVQKSSRPIMGLFVPIILAISVITTIASIGVAIGLTVGRPNRTPVSTTTLIPINNLTTSPTNNLGNITTTSPTNNLGNITTTSTTNNLGNITTTSPTNNTGNATVILGPIENLLAVVIQGLLNRFITGNLRDAVENINRVQVPITIAVNKATQGDHTPMSIRVVPPVDFTENNLTFKCLAIFNRSCTSFPITQNCTSQRTAILQTILSGLLFLAVPNEQSAIISQATSVTFNKTENNITQAMAQNISDALIAESNDTVATAIEFAFVAQSGKKTPNPEFDDELMAWSPDVLTAQLNARNDLPRNLMFFDITSLKASNQVVEGESAATLSGKGRAVYNGTITDASSKRGEIANVLNAPSPNNVFTTVPLRDVPVLVTVTNAADPVLTAGELLTPSQLNTEAASVGFKKTKVNNIWIPQKQRNPTADGTALVVQFDQLNQNCVVGDVEYSSLFSQLNTFFKTIENFIDLRPGSAIVKAGALDPVVNGRLRINLGSNIMVFGSEGEPVTNNMLVAAIENKTLTLIIRNGDVISRCMSKISSSEFNMNDVIDSPEMSFFESKARQIRRSNGSEITKTTFTIEALPVNAVATEDADGDCLIATGPLDGSSLQTTISDNLQEDGINLPQPGAFINGIRITAASLAGVVGPPGPNNRQLRLEGVVYHTSVKSFDVLTALLDPAGGNAEIKLPIQTDGGVQCTATILAADITALSADSITDKVYQSLKIWEDDVRLEDVIIRAN